MVQFCANSNASVLSLKISDYNNTRGFKSETIMDSFARLISSVKCGYLHAAYTTTSPPEKNLPQSKYQSVSHPAQPARNTRKHLVLLPRPLTNQLLLHGLRHLRLPLLAFFFLDSLFMCLFLFFVLEAFSAGFTICIAIGF